jgi:hypothetical protein
VTGDEPTIDDVRRAFPGWTVYRGTDQRWRARPASTAPPVQPVVGEDLLDLTDEIKLYISRAEMLTPGISRMLRGSFVGRATV